MNRPHDPHVRPPEPPRKPKPPVRPGDAIDLGRGCWAAKSAVIFSFSRSRGPGGQNVNKVSTAVELRFEAERSPNLPPPVKARLKRLAGRRWTTEGAIVLQVEDTRSQARNREIARERLAELIRQAHELPEKRAKSRLNRVGKEKRLAGKKLRGSVKAGRGKVSFD